MPPFDWSRRSVLLTGGAGFLGRAVHRLLRERGARHVHVPRRVACDLTRQDDVARLFAEVRPDVVLHLAAEVGGIGANRANPGRYFFANMAMGLNLVEQARLSGVERFVQVGTICAYPKFTPVPFRETDLWEGFPEETNAPYGVAKKALLVMLQAYRDQYGLRGSYLLPVNLYGPGDNFDLATSHVIPALIRKFDRARRDRADHVEVWGTGTATREFLYVDDCAEGVLLAAERLDDPVPVNLGTGREVSIRALAELIRDLVGFDGAIRWNSDYPDGQPRRCLDTTRAESLLGFRARTGLEDGLRRTIAWWRQRQHDGGDAEAGQPAPSGRARSGA